MSNEPMPVLNGSKGTNDQIPTADQLITLKEAAEYSGFTDVYLRILIHRGKLEAVKRGVQWFTTRKAVRQYITSRKKTGGYREDVGLDTLRE